MRHPVLVTHESLPNISISSLFLNKPILFVMVLSLNKTIVNIKIMECKKRRKHASNDCFDRAMGIVIISDVLLVSKRRTTYCWHQDAEYNRCNCTQISISNIHSVNQHCVMFVCWRLCHALSS